METPYESLEAENRALKAKMLEDRWWWEVFARRLSPGSRIKPGIPLHGYRFRLQLDSPGEGWVELPQSLLIT